MDWACFVPFPMKYLMQIIQIFFSSFITNNAESCSHVLHKVRLHVWVTLPLLPQIEKQRQFRFKLLTFYLIALLLSSTSILHPNLSLVKVKSSNVRESQGTPFNNYWIFPCHKDIFFCPLSRVHSFAVGCRIVSIGIFVHMTSNCK